MVARDADRRPSHVNLNPDRISGTLKMFSRLGSFPLDSSSVFDTYEDLLAYVGAEGSYAYGGQLVAVANGSVESYNGAIDYSFYLIRSDLSLQSLSDTLVFDTIELAETYVSDSQPSPGKTLTIKNGDSLELYIVNIDSSLTRVSFHSSDVPDMEWSSIIHGPSSTPEEIDRAVEDADHHNRLILDQLSEDLGGELVYNGDVLATREEASRTVIVTNQPIDPVENQVYFAITE